MGEWNTITWDNICIMGLPQREGKKKEKDGGKEIKRILLSHVYPLKGFPGGSVGKESACNAEDTGDRGLIPVSGRSPGRGNGNPLQYSCLENPWTEEHGRLQRMGSQRAGHD